MMEALDDHTFHGVYRYCKEMYTTLRLTSKAIHAKLCTRIMALDHIRHLYGDDVYHLVRTKDGDMMRYLTSDGPWISLMGERYPQVTPHLIIAPTRWGHILQKNIRHRKGGRAKIFILQKGRRPCDFNVDPSRMYYGDRIYIGDSKGHRLGLAMKGIIGKGGEVIHTMYIPVEVIKDFPMSYFRGNGIVMSNEVLDQIISSMVQVPSGEVHSSFTHRGEVHKMVIGPWRDTTPHTIQDLREALNRHDKPKGHYVMKMDKDGVFHILITMGHTTMMGHTTTSST